jgi:predicted glycosyltransferase
MKIIQYCQHVLGVGHLVRTLEILKAFKGHEVILVNGGAPVEFPLPGHVREFRLPAMMMDTQFKKLLPVENGLSLNAVKAARKERLFDLFDAERPDLFIVELFPFGRRAFTFEIEPVLRAIHEGVLPSCFVSCSLRDILVESKKHWDAYEKEVIGRLNTYFNALCIHSDPDIIRLDETFNRMADIKIPLVYTGFVAQQVSPGAGLEKRRVLDLSEGDRLIVASAGGGKVGFSLLQAVCNAFKEMRVTDPKLHLIIFTGPFMEEAAYQTLLAGDDERIDVRRFSLNFLSYLAAADLSVSMAGYNTCMNIFAAETPALVRPFAQNREQGMRAERLAGIGAVEILRDCDFQKDRLANRMRAAMSAKWRLSHGIDLDGAKKTARWLLRQSPDRGEGS